MYLLSGDKIMFLSLVVKEQLPNGGQISRQSKLHCQMRGMDIAVGYNSFVGKVSHVHSVRIWWDRERRESRVEEKSESFALSIFLQLRPLPEGQEHYT